MQKKLVVLVMLLLVGLTSCEKEVEKQPLPNGIREVTVLESIPVKDYTYINVSENDNEFWIAVPTMTVEKGQTLYFSKSLEMKNFQSPTIDRNFESILFVEDIKTMAPNSEHAGAVVQHPKIEMSGKQPISLSPVDGGKTVEQVFAQSESLSGKVVKVRGKVTKFNQGIMDRNWIHIQDGTGNNDDFDLLITSNDVVKLGDIIVIEGVVGINKDFGAGYTYAVIVENAKVTIEKNS
ncbi:MAG: GW dipeptide domain-containing protein [Ignavibacteria bacterium]|nr:GW dipeptide domain-containing protein [Ignavibacteria bacterium]